MKHEKITNEFISIIESDKEIKRLMEKDLELAKKNNPDKKTNPAQSLDELYDFIDWSVKCMPWNCLKDVQYDSLFTALDQTTGYFWYLFDQPLEELKNKGYFYPSLQYFKPIANWIKKYSKTWGKYLSSKKSWNEEYYQLAKQEEQLGLTKGWYGDKNIWKTYNEFFSRKLKDKYQRPIGNADVISPADSEPKGFYKIDQNNKLIDKTVNLKSARLNSIEDLIGKDSKYCTSFKGGTLTHTYLNICDYHRYHFPVGGKILEMRKISGINGGGIITEWDEKTKQYVYFNEVGFQMIETRDCLILENEKFGLVAILPVGMSQVCSCNWSKGLKVGKTVKKGDEMGYFMFGGSDVVMIFQKGIKLHPLIKKESKNQYAHILACEPYANITIEKE